MIIFRRDAGRFSTIRVDELRKLLDDPALKPDHELFFNKVGNIAVAEFGPSLVAPDNNTRWYVGYIDIATMEVHVQEGNDFRSAPGFPIQDPFQQIDHLDVKDGSGHEANSVPFDPSQLK